MNLRDDIQSDFFSISLLKLIIINSSVMAACASFIPFVFPRPGSQLIGRPAA